MASNIKTKKLDNVVYLLGAGFSAPLGIPVMSNFLEKSKDMFAVAPDQYANFERVFTTINKMSKSKNYFNSNLFNIEEILSILEMSEELGNEEEKSLFKNYIIDVVQYYTPKLIKRDNINPWNWKSEIFLSTDNEFNPYYSYFVGSLLNLSISTNSKGDFFFNQLGEKRQPARYSAITLNYDMILENCFSYYVDNYHANNTIGFSNKTEKSQEQFLQNTHLAKLHGSVDTKMIVPPTWNKGLYEDIKPAWQLAGKLLTEANHIRIIGYSLPVADAYIKYLLKAAIIRCDYLKSIDVLCLDRDGSVKDRYDELICYPNYRFINSDIKDYLLMNGPSDGDFDDNSIYMDNLETVHKAFFDHNVHS